MSRVGSNSDRRRCESSVCVVAEEQMATQLAECNARCRYARLLCQANCNRFHIVTRMSEATSGILAMSGPDVASAFALRATADKSLTRATEMPES